MAEFFDTHAHLDYPDFAADLPETLERARAAGIAKMICIGTDLESSRRAVALSDRFACVYAAVGWHPSYATGAPGDVKGPLRELAVHPKVVAIGETGLDYYRLPSKKEGADPAADLAYKRKQADIFQQQLELAAELGLNCIIHQRDSLEDTLAQAENFQRKVRTVFHCFGESEAVRQRIAAAGGLVSFTGIATFKNGQNARQTIASAPLNEMMLETDCPFLAPVPHRGKRCEPAYVRDIAETIAQVKGCSIEEVGEQTCQAARAFFPKLG